MEYITEIECHAYFINDEKQYGYEVRDTTERETLKRDFGYASLEDAKIAANKWRENYDKENKMHADRSQILNDAPE